MKGRTKFNIMFAILIVSTLTVSAQDDGFIYGKITTIDGDEYKGALRWGKEEVYWTDLFNSSREENKNIEFLSREDINYLEDLKRNGYGRSNDSWSQWTSHWDWSDNDYIHQFNCQFGEIKSLNIRGRERLDVVLQNGKIIEVDGGSNDIGTSVNVKDEELGEIKISWDRIEKVDFLPTPTKLEEKFGNPLYGTVETEIGEFTGYVQWDHDERVSEDKLDGDTYDGDVSIAFSKIKSIERSGYSKSLVVLNSGRELELRGSNDVNSENRGIIVTVDGLGRVDVPWRDFIKATFSAAPNSGKSYNFFKDQKEMSGTVKLTNGDTQKGRIVFDLDEEYNLELLHGKKDNIEFIIPFRNIKDITPKNYDYSKITLVSGEEWILGESQDVSDKNEGLLVFKGNESIYIPWVKIEKISLD